jgi:hypothetical protein
MADIELAEKRTAMGIVPSTGSTPLSDPFSHPSIHVQIIQRIP